MLTPTERLAQAAYQLRQMMGNGVIDIPKLLTTLETNDQEKP